jgi:hypothetical protein
MGEARRMVATYEAEVGPLEPAQAACALSYTYLEAGGAEFRSACRTCGPHESCAQPAHGCSFEVGDERVIVIHTLARNFEETMRHEVLHHIHRCTDQPDDVDHEGGDWSLVWELVQAIPSPGCVSVQG